jgi:hypothetical protein
MDSIWRIFATLAVFASVTVTQAPAQDPAPGDDKDALARAAVVGCAANVDAFPFYKCRYRVTKAQAKSAEDAVQGKLLNTVSYDNRLIVDGEKEVYEGLEPPVPPDAKHAVAVPGKKGAFMVPSSPVISDRYLDDGKREMNYCPQLRAAGLWSREKGFHGVAYTPLGRLHVDHRKRAGPVTLMSQPESFEMSGEGIEDIEGRPAVAVRYRNKQYGWAERYSFDMGRGYLPIRLVIFIDGKNPKTYTFLTHVRECSNGRWFPERSVEVDLPDKAGDLCDVTELQVLELDADHRPAASEFAVTVPAGTQMNDGVEGKKVFYLKQDEKIHVDELPALFKMLDQAQVTPLMDTAVPHGSPYLWARWLGIGAGVILALAGVAFLLWRRFRPRTA